MDGDGAARPRRFVGKKAASGVVTVSTPIFDNCGFCWGIFFRHLPMMKLLQLVCAIQFGPFYQIKSSFQQRLHLQHQNLSSYLEFLQSFLMMQLSMQVLRECSVRVSHWSAEIAKLPANYNFEVHKTVWRIQQVWRIHLDRCFADHCFLVHKRQMQSECAFRCQRDS